MAEFVVADLERVLLLLVTCLLLLCWVPFALCGTDETRGELFHSVLALLNGGREIALHKYFLRYDGQIEVWGIRRSALRWPVMDSALWALVGSRSKSSSLMSLCGMAGRTRVNIVEERGLGLSLIDRIVYHHPYSYLSRSLCGCPYGHHLPAGDMATRRSAVMLRAVGETLVVDSLFHVFSIQSESWDGPLSLAATSLIFSVLELVTELQYYAIEASDEMEPGEDHTTRTNTMDKQSDQLEIELGECASLHGPMGRPNNPANRQLSVDLTDSPANRQLSVDLTDSPVSRQLSVDLTDCPASRQLSMSNQNSPRGRQLSILYLAC